MLLNLSRDDAEKRVWDLGLRAFTMLGNVSIVCGKCGNPRQASWPACLSRYLSVRACTAMLTCSYLFMSI